ncbi:MAG TPA: hypothetical protein PKI14_01280 [Fervidobacterium sp.]|nr:hypothetical protein [Fervidobacterium sp.]
MFKDIREILRDKYPYAYFEKAGRISNEIYHKTNHRMFTQVNYRLNVDATGKMNATQMFKVKL